MARAPRLATASILVFGAVPELAELAGDREVLRCSPNDSVEHVVAATLVLDLRTFPADALARARRHPALSWVPALVVTEDEVADDVLDALGATDVLRLPASRAAVERRFATLVELGERRLGLRGADTTAKGTPLEIDLELERRRFDRLVAMGTMVAGFAHEIRNPVAALLSMVEEVGEELTAAGIELPHVARMVQILQRIERLVRTSLQFGRPATPQCGHHRAWTIITNAVAEVGPRTRAAGQELRFDIEQELPDVFCDEGQIAQALVILLNNALDATASPSRVLVRALRNRSHDLSRARSMSEPPPNGGWVRLEVIDDGPGIPPEIIGRIFDPFFTTKASGTGLGLSIAQNLVSENRAHLEVSSTRGGPTTFAILVPARS